MEENEIIDIGKRNNVNTNHKSNKKTNNPNKKILIIIGIIIVLLIAFLIIYLHFATDKPVEKENLVYTEFDPLVTRLDDETVYIFGAKKSISFEVTPDTDFSYQVSTKDNTEVTTTKNTKGSNVIIKSDSYEDGETYILKIDKGKFANDKYKDAKKIIFNIARPAANSYTLKEGVTVLENAKVEKDKLTTDGTYKENDIVALSENNKVTNTYKITKVNDDGTYDITNPRIDEVFETIDYYGMEQLNLSSFATNEELKNYLVGMVSSQILNSLVKTVYAKESIEIKEPSWDKKSQSLVFSIIIDAKDNTKLFGDNVLKNHQASTELYVSVKANLYKDVALSDYDYALSLTYTVTKKTNITSTDKKLTELNDNIRNNKKEYDATWLLKDYEKITNDKIDINKNIGNVIILTEVPGLNVNFDLNFIMNTDIKAILEGNVSDKITATMGMNSNKEIYGSFDLDSNGNETILGDGNLTFGFGSKTSINFLDDSVESSLNSLMYVNSKSEIKEKEGKTDKDNKTITYELKSSIGYNETYTLNGVVKEEKLTKKVFDKKEELKTYEKQAEFTKPKDKEDEEESEYKYTKEEIKQKLTDAYNVLAGKEEWSSHGSSITVSFTSEKTIDVNNNKITGTVTYDGSTSYTCSYNYLDETMSCSNFETAQDYVKSTCDNLYNDYLEYVETGETDNEDAIEWEELYEDIDSCYYETIGRNEPANYKEDLNKILNQAQITRDDLKVLK